MNRQTHKIIVILAVVFILIIGAVCGLKTHEPNMFTGGFTDVPNDVKLFISPLMIK